MARLARIVVPGLPHYVTQRGSRGQDTFFSAADCAAYRALLAEFAAKAGTEVWAYCLMPDHVHLILVPSHADGLRAALGEAHRRYARRINARAGWRGHLWQERFHSFALDEAHLAACARYVERSPVEAKLAPRARDWRWSSARAHLESRDDALVSVAPLLRRCGDWAALLGEPVEPDTLETLRRHARSGRPLGDAAFVARLEALTGRALAPRRPGRRHREPAKS